MFFAPQACVVFFDEVDAIGGARFDDGAGGDNEVQRTMLEIVNQLDGFDARGNVKVCNITEALGQKDQSLPVTGCHSGTILIHMLRSYWEWELEDLRFILCGRFAHSARYLQLNVARRASQAGACP